MPKKGKRVCEIFKRASVGENAVFCFWERKSEREKLQYDKPQKRSFDSAHLGPFRHNALARERD